MSGKKISAQQTGIFRRRRRMLLFDSTSGIWRRAERGNLTRRRGGAEFGAELTESASDCCFGDSLGRRKRRESAACFSFFMLRPALDGRDSRFAGFWGGRGL